MNQIFNGETSCTIFSVMLLMSKGAFRHVRMCSHMLKGTLAHRNSSDLPTTSMVSNRVFLLISQTSITETFLQEIVGCILSRMDRDLHFHILFNVVVFFFQSYISGKWESDNKSCEPWNPVYVSNFNYTLNQTLDHYVGQPGLNLLSYWGSCRVWVMDRVNDVMSKWQSHQREMNVGHAHHLHSTSFSSYIWQRQHNQYLRFWMLYGVHHLCIIM